MLKKIIGFFNQEDDITGQWIGQSYNIKGFTRKEGPNSFQLIFHLQLENIEQFTGYGEIIPLDGDGAPIYDQKFNVTLDGKKYASSKIINYSGKIHGDPYRGSCILKGKIDKREYHEEGNAVAYADSDPKVLVSFLEFKKITA